MKKLILPLLAAALLFGCNVAKTAESSTDTKNSTSLSLGANSSPTPAAPAATPALADAETQKILGSYVGPFGDNKITMLITKVTADSAISGRTIVGGNDRPFDGTFKNDNGVITVEAKEPGDHKDDGVFNFQIANGSDKVSGTWQANDAKRPKKMFNLDRKKFEYRTDVGQWPEASTRLLKAKDVENLKKGDLTFMRQEIFARHGYCFSKKEYRQQFENEEWYVPATVDIKGLLTDLEKQNITMIRRYEKYADDYGDEYGR